PLAYAPMYASLAQDIAAFDQAISSQWDGSRTAVSFGAELLNGNANNGLKLLDPAAATPIQQELDRLQSLGVKAVDLSIGFPILYQPFYAFNQDPQDYQSMTDFYRQLASEIRKRGLKVIVESTFLFTPGTLDSSNTSKGPPGMDLVDYLPTLTDEQFTSAR